MGTNMGCKNQPSGPIPPCGTKPHEGNTGSATTTRPKEARALLSDAQFTDVLRTVLDNNPGMDITMASRIVVEALKFVAAAATFPDVPIAPTREVDEGWHALILHTHLYHDLCRRLGRHVHHYPERPDSGRFDASILTRTVALIEQTGYTPDRDLWVAPEQAIVTVVASCSHTPVPGGCGPINPGKCATHGGGKEQ
ncbi:glycine-rich domain-containing protein [Streptomyces sp. NPDC101132]|uniref:glycine-rich domain-containing protein n=1 Tax=Streptomyces sp. NPDC101132 TaxID=3366110 RepID=UPI003829675C